MKRISFLIILFLIEILNADAQECGFVAENYQTFEEFNQQRIANTNQYCINVCFRIVRNNDGTEAAVSPSIIPSALAQLNAAFNPHGIYFNQVGTYDYINNTNYNNYISTASNSPANLSNCLNIYFIKTFLNLGSGTAGISSFGTNRATIKGSLALSNNNIAHEVGHALNLLHTFECTSVPAQTCTDNPSNTSQCSVKGDNVCDTPADYNPLIYTSSNPPPFPISNYNPLTNNIMSYWLNKTQFTIGQGIRMKNAIIGAPQLQSIRSLECTKILGDAKLCTLQGVNYSISDFSLGTQPTYNWSVSGDLQINGPNTNAIVNISRTNPVNSSTPSILSITLNGTITKSKTISTSCKFDLSTTIGLYDWVSKNYGNMGLIITPEPNDTNPNDPIVSYSWEIKEDTSSINNNGTKAYFVGALTNEPYKFTTNVNQAIVNWGNCSKSYLITCYKIRASGEQHLVCERYIDVGDPENNPCFKNFIQSIIAPNPVTNGQINVSVIKTENTTPCNYKNDDEPQYFNGLLDRINNSITIFDYNGNEIYSNVFETNTFTINNLNLVSGNNYVVNLYTNEGGFKQQVIIAE